MVEIHSLGLTAPSLTVKSALFSRWYRVPWALGGRAEKGLLYSGWETAASLSVCRGAITRCIMVLLYYFPDIKAWRTHIDHGTQTGLLSPPGELQRLSFPSLLIRGRCSHLWNTRKPRNTTALSKWPQLYAPFRCWTQSWHEGTINGEDDEPSGDETRACIIGETTVWSIHCGNAIASLISETKWPLDWVKDNYDVLFYIFN